MREDLLLFVSGVSSKATPEEVMLFFSQIGDFQLLRLRSNKKGSRLMFANPQNNIRRGFCILQAADRESFGRLLDASGSLFKGRVLSISKLRDSAEFSEYSKHLSKRCVLVADVPKTFSPTTLAEILAASCGSVKKIVHMKKSKRLLEPTSAFSRSYLVEFSEEHHAQRALIKKWVEIPTKNRSVLAPITLYHRKANMALGSQCHWGMGPQTTDSHMTHIRHSMMRVSTVRMKHQQVQEVASNAAIFRPLDHFSKPTSKFYRRPILHSEGSIPGGDADQQTLPVSFKVVFGKYRFAN